MEKNNREPIAWITVNGAHVPIYDSSWMSSEQREHYSRFIDDHRWDDRLDSDEKTWVAALRKEKELKEAEDRKNAQIEANQQEAKRLNAQDKKEEVKPWTKTEQKRSEEMSKYVNDKLHVGEEFGEFYEETPVEEIASRILPATKNYKQDEVTITKMNITYVQNWDENDRRVKKGKVVTGSTYYVVQDDNGSIDESCFAYKTKADAIHAMELYYQEEIKRRNK